MNDHREVDDLMTSCAPTLLLEEPPEMLSARFLNNTFHLCQLKNTVVEKLKSNGHWRGWVMKVTPCGRIPCVSQRSDLSHTAIQINCHHVSAGQSSKARRAECCLGAHPNELATSNCGNTGVQLTSGFDAVAARLGGGGGGWLGGGTLGRLMGGGGGRSVGGRRPTVLGLVGGPGELLWWWLGGKVREGSKFSSAENLWFCRSERFTLMLLVRAVLLEERESPLG
ncbi:hypothetical protein E2C01_013931 [Portunus trituberculatus]|uniref:Uncharacterized protein n=1 Tax=Portunus trituberculatus TaxID=210409 RepID=A0A5B7DIQ8_PORTR|nr:hypothetical protein [Portunus trituberculatus]